MKIKKYIESYFYGIEKGGRSYIGVDGWFFATDGSECSKVTVKINGQECDAVVEKKSRPDVNSHYGRKYNIGAKEEVGFEAKIYFDKDSIRNVSIEVSTKGNVTKSRTILRLNRLQIKRKILKYLRYTDKIAYCFDNRNIGRKYITIMGWAADTTSEEPVGITVIDSKKRVVEEAEVVRNVRRDVYSLLDCACDLSSGFLIKFKYSLMKRYYLRMTCSGGKEELVVKLGVIKIFLRKLLKKLRPRSKAVSYQKWIKKNQPSKKELDRQREYKFKYKPLISVVIPLYETEQKFFCQLVDSILSQTYQNFEICFADGSRNDFLKTLIDTHYPGESRIKYKKLEKNLFISENTNEAIKMSSGDFVAFTDHDDLLTPDAMYEIVFALNSDSEIDAVYSDEDKTDFENKKYFEPHFKPDFSIDLLRATNYICHLFAVKRELLNEAGYLRSEFNGAQDYDFVLRCCEKAKKIYHIPKVLYHWRCHENSTAGNPQSKMYAFEAGKEAIKAHYRRIGIEADVEMTQNPGWYRSRFGLKDRPLISIIIPNKDHTEDLDKCLKSIKRSTYNNYEIIIVENNSENTETFDYYKKLENEKCRVIYWKNEFNYSAINNFGAKEAVGEYLILLNNDTEIITQDWMEEMLGYCQRADVAVVGARLYYPDDTIQHAGVVLGAGGIAGHIVVGQYRYDPGYMARALTPQDMSVVTAACMMVKKRVYDEVGGLDERLKIAFNDVDFCMKVRAKNYLIVYNPYAELYHYESKSRGVDDTPKKAARFAGEIALFKSKWENELKKGDPYYNPNFSLVKADYSLKGENESFI